MLTGPGSFRFLIDKLVELEKTIDGGLRVYRWQPADSVDLPALWNWIGAGPFRQFDQKRWIDDITVLVRLGVFHNDVDEDMEKIEALVDAFRETIDPALYALESGPLSGAAYKAERNDMRNVTIELGGIPVFAMEFPITFHVQRTIAPNG
jgi:hypothetical protein